MKTSERWTTTTSPLFHEIYSRECHDCVPCDYPIIRLPAIAIWHGCWTFCIHRRVCRHTRAAIRPTIWRGTALPISVNETSSVQVMRANPYWSLSLISNVIGFSKSILIAETCFGNIYWAGVFVFTAESEMSEIRLFTYTLISSIYIST